MANNMFIAMDMWFPESIRHQCLGSQADDGVVGVTQVRNEASIKS